jgi:uncharacterized protein (TIGR02453 family)
MPTIQEFEGFPPSALRFFADLKENNDRDWFEANKSIYVNDVVEPARAFITTLGGMLSGLHPGINFDTRSNGAGSMFRIYRDVRFSKDKTPYKTHLGMVFWIGSGKKTDSPAFYVGLSNEGTGVYAGMWKFPKDALAAYRTSIDDPSKADELAEILDGLRDAGYEVGGNTYKRVPRGFDPEHPHADLLKHSAVNAGKPKIDPAIITTPAFVPLAFEHCANYYPLVAWLTKNI